MLYNFIQYLISFSSWSFLGWLVILTGIAVAYALPSLLRLFLVPFMALEFYFMTNSFACGGNLIMFNRAYGTESACTPLDYSHYLSSNFGFEHGYVILGYIGVAIFMVWPVIKKGIYAHKEELQRNIENKAAAIASNNETARIEKIKRIGNI